MVYQHERLDRTFAALSDPTRREILSRLAQSDRTIGELAARFDMSLPAVSKHIYVLARAGLATVEQHGRVRRTTLNAAPMRAALEWIERYKRFWQSELDLLAKYLERQTDTLPTESAWPTKLQPQESRASKSGARSARRGKKSSTRGRRRRS